MQTTTNSDELVLPFDTFQLANGLTVIVHEDRKAPVVAVNITYLVGAKDEPPGRTGFAHLFEHLMFGGSKNFPGSYLRSMLQAGASSLNGTTNLDRTNYYETVPTSALDYALFAESDRMGHFAEAITQETLDQQRGVVSNEKRQTEGRPYGRVYEHLLRVMYPPQHPYAHTVLGSMEDLAKATLADVREWFATFYGPANAILVLAGDIDLVTARRKAELFFGDIPPGRTPERRSTHTGVPRLGEAWRETLEDQVPFAQLNRVWNVPPYGDADTTRLQLVAALLAGRSSARLDRMLVHGPASLASSVSCSVMPGQLAGLFSITVMGGAQGLDAVACEARITATLDELREHCVSGEELGRVKTMRLAGFIHGLTDAGAVANLLSDSQRLLGAPDAYRRVLQQVREATPHNVRETVRRWLGEHSLHLQVEPARRLKAANHGYDRAAPPPLKQVPAPRLPVLQRAMLSNGLKLVLAERHERPVLEMRLLMPGGHAVEPHECDGLAALTARMLTQGAGERDAFAFAEAQQALGANLSVRAGIDWTTFTLSTLTSTLRPALGLLADALLRPRLDAADLHRERRLQRQTIAQEMNVPASVLARVLPMLLFPPGHAYARPWSGSGNDAALEHLTRTDVQIFHATWYVPDGTTLVVVGDTTLGPLVAQLEACLADWTGTHPAVPPVVATLPVPMRGIHVLHRDQASQSMVAAALFAPPVEQRTEAALRIADQVLGGSFASRINMNLRENKHWTYGAQAQLLDLRGPRPYVMQASVQADKTGDAMQELHAELRAIVSSRRVTNAELAPLRHAEAARLAAMTESVGGLANAIEHLVRHDLPDTHWPGYAEQLLALDAGEVNAAMQRLVDPRRMTWVVVGERSRIDDQLLATGLGSLEAL